VGGLAAPGPDGELPFEPEPEVAAVILFTSGSSGTPKAALLTHDNLLSYVMETVEFASAEEDEALILAAPPFHIAGVAAVLTSVYSGRRLLPLPAFTPEGWLTQARDQRATHAFLVPTMLARIVRAMQADPDLRVPSLRALSYGGARMSLPVLEQALELFPEVDFVNAYGLTETSSTIAVLGPDEHRAAFTSNEPAVQRRLRSAGRPLPGVEIAIVDLDGVPAAMGATGEIRVRGPQVSGRYLDSASGLDAGGWLVTGDVGFVDEDGYLFVESRADDVIIKGGENLSPSEIEDVLLRHPQVVTVAVVGIPHTEWGETVAAAVVIEQGDYPTDSGRTAEDLSSWVREHLGSFKVPGRIEVFEELPTTATGKILRRVVRDQLAGD
jgi:acyl-CoA synthetase (AMP-forming)/AMP-acid ligase II